MVDSDSFTSENLSEQDSIEEYQESLTDSNAASPRDNPEGRIDVSNVDSSPDKRIESSQSMELSG